MKEWLLKDEVKNKVGRPKLADDDIVKKAKISITICLFVSILMSFIFFCKIKDVPPLEFLYSNTFERLTATSSNSKGFIVNEKYDSNSDYIMQLTPSSIINSYSGSYKYILYKLDGNDWKKVEEKSFDKGTKTIKIKVESKKNKNVTYKINLYILNASKIEKSFAPFAWKFVDSSKQEEKYAYKIFTVKGYYSSVSQEEMKESNKNKESKVTVTTSKENPREFSLSVPNAKYDIKVSYTDESGKVIELKKESNLSGVTKYEVPNVNKISSVTFKIWIDNADKYKLSNWELKKDKKGNEYITNTYLLKPEGNYINK